MNLVIEPHRRGAAGSEWLYVKDHIDTAFTIIRADAPVFPIVNGISDAANRRWPFPDFTYEVASELKGLFDDWMLSTRWTTRLSGDSVTPAGLAAAYRR
ncbi:MAG TPA: hypothetical protein VKQ05_07010 [Gemmatimonadales bacterium]|nr:hypothetical protein [Gemmatimonadales bacterium]